MYADDITLYCSAKSINEDQSNLQTCVHDTIKWLQTNKLVVNPSKCNSRPMLVGSRQKVSILTLKNMINIIPVTYTQAFKLLGVTVDSNRTWGNHIINISKQTLLKLALLKGFVLYCQILSFLNYIHLYFNLT